jgi:hypothetical protein
VRGGFRDGFGGGHPVSSVGASGMIDNVVDVTNVITLSDSASSNWPYRFFCKRGQMAVLT